MNPDFKILRLRLFENFIFEDIDVQFYDARDKPKEPYTTLIIGPNGTGKSNLQRILILLFAELSEFKKTEKRNAKILGRFSLDYSLNGSTYRYFNYDFEANDVENEKKREQKPQVLCNGKVINASEIEIPEAVIALSVMLTDKFPPAIPDFPGYIYLGVKVNSNTARTTSFINKTIDLLYETLEDQEVTQNILHALDFLGYERKLFVSYYPRYKHFFFKGNVTVDEFERFFTHFWEYTRRAKENPPWSLNAFNKLKESSSSRISNLVKLCNKLTDHLEYEYEGGRTQYFEFDVFDNFLNKEELELLKTLHSLDIISYPTIGFYKKDKYFMLHDSSSGEYHFISGFIGLLAKIKQNSLILIDEPENSLHPNWQMKYISFLKKVFKNYRSCHMVLTSHSHFMVSDLTKESSTIVGLSKDKKITATAIPANTYGWSAEEILLNVFQTASTRNYYLSEELGEIFQLVSEEPSKRNVIEIKKRITRLKKIDLSGLSKEDPLKDVINKLFQKFANA
jgi:predicted ATP-dependent endonuclease of OLD family